MVLAQVQRVREGEPGPRGQGGGGRDPAHAEQRGSERGLVADPHRHVVVVDLLDERVASDRCR
jgi:hypothetical protein